jgi:hypothetical protein
MTKVVLDDSFKAKLNGLQDQLELRDELGHILGYFIPATSHDPSLYARVHSPISDEELERRSNETGGRTLAQIWTRLGQS